MQRNSYRIVSYKVRHHYELDEFLRDYRFILQKAIDEIWENIE